MIPAVKYNVSTSLWRNRESLWLYTSSSRYQQDIDLTLCSLRGVRRTHRCATIKPVVASPLCEKWEQRTLPAFPPQIWKIAIQKVRSLAWWSETVRQHMNTPGLLNIGKGKPTKTNEFSDKFRRGRGGVVGQKCLAFQCVLFWFFSLNYWKTYPENTLLYHFHAKKALFKSPNFAT